MTQKTFTVAAGIIFTLVAGLHLLRIVLGWDAVIGGWDVPRWISWPALAVSGFLGYTAFALSRGLRAPNEIPTGTRWAQPPAAPGVRRKTD